MHRLVLCLAGVLVLGACGAPRAKVRVTARGPVRERAEPNVPDYATKPYEPFSREAVLAITLREWRVFGQPVDDDPPGTRPPPLPDQKPEQFEGLWQRVGDYWYQGQDLDRPEASWTGKHDAWGTEFPADEDGDYAWSAAFVSYVMRVAGAGARFPYSPAHHIYIDAARRMASGEETGWAITAWPIDSYAPVPGDVICTSRTPIPVRYADLPRGDFQAHCDIIVEQSPGLLSVIGGNVDDAVTMKHVPVTPGGMLGTTADSPLDSRYPWFVVLRVQYDVPVAANGSDTPRLAQR